DAEGLSRQTQALLKGRQKFQSIRRYYYAMATLDDWMKSKQYSIQEVLRMKPGFIIPLVMAWFISQHRTPKSSLNKQSCIKTMLQLISDREPMHDTPSVLNYRAISNCNVVTRKFAHVWDIDVLFNRWATQPADQMLTNQDLQIKLASLLLSVCFLRITEISEIDLNLSNFNFGNHTALITLSPKITNVLEQYEVRRIGILNLCPNETLFTEVQRLREQFHQEITILASLFWTEQWKLMSIVKISELLTLPIKKIGIEGFTMYTINLTSITKLAEMGIQERDLNMFTNHAPDSKSARNYYVFAANRQVNGIAARLVTIDHGLENQDSTSTSVTQ
ncbi:MAG: hypothetical protein EZS28_048190, partial [Streblomastix strix]